MDNNFNQYNSQNSSTNYTSDYNTGYDKIYNQSYNQNTLSNYEQPQFDVVNAGGIGGYESQPRYHVLTVPDKPNILLGTLGALLVVVLGTLIWIAIEVFTGYVLVFLATGIIYTAMYLYEKFAKGIDTVGVVICTILTCIGVYFANRYGYICSIAYENDYSISGARTIHDFMCDTDDVYNIEYLAFMGIS